MASLFFSVSVPRVFECISRSVGPTQKSELCRLGWFSSVKYNIGGLDYSADDIEHGCLRGNRPTAGSLSVLVGHPEWSQGYFKKENPRLKQVWTPEIGSDQGT